MTRSERFIQRRGWLKTHHFAITNSLRKTLESSALPVEQQERLAYIQNRVLISKYHHNLAFINSRYWADKCGNQYKRYIDQLVEWNELHVNNRYRATKDDLAFSKSFRVPQTARASGICTLNFNIKRFHPPTPDNEPIDDASHYALKCLSLLEVVIDDDFVLPKDPIRRSRIKEHCEHIAFKDFGLGYGKNSKRLYHRVVMMPTEGRRNLKHFCMPLVEFDVKSCHPFFLLSLFDDAEERKQYHDLIIHGDIYNIAGKATGVTNREKQKKDFLRVMNAGRKDEEWLGKMQVFNFFQQAFPRFTKSVLSQRTDLAIYLQNLEAEMLVQQLGKFCRDNNLFWIPMHDGWISIPGDGEQIKHRAAKIISGKIGFEPVFTDHLINQL